MTVSRALFHVFVSCVLVGLGVAPLPVAARQREPTPVRQSALTAETATAATLTLRDASRNDRWLGLGVRDVRWAPDGSVVYFRWNRSPLPDDVPDADPWFRADPDGTWVEEVARPDESLIPGEEISWSPDGRTAAWGRGSAVFVFRSGAEPETRQVVDLTGSVADVRIAERGAAVHFQAGDALFRYDVATGATTTIAHKVSLPAQAATAEGRWLAGEQRALFEHVREQERRREVAAAAAADRGEPQAIPVPASVRLEQITLSPDGRVVTFRARTPASDRPETQYVDYLDPSGYSRVHDARSKAGEPRDRYRLGIVDVDSTVPADSVRVRWVDLAEAGDEATVPHGPYWNPEGTRAVAQLIGEDDKDVWFAEIDPATGAATILAHDHDDAWIGGPPVQANYLQPALMEWLPGDRLVFASERSGWSHLYRMDPDGEVTPLTTGAWEVRGATLSRDRSWWLIQASREHPADDHLYRMPAAGGEMTRLTDGAGRQAGFPSPDGRRLALVSDDATHMPDLYLGPVDAPTSRRVTVSGTDAYFQHPLVAPEIVSFRHPDGGPLWAAVYRPEHPDPSKPALIHVHGGGYRQFAHRGWTVYGYALHLGFLNYMVQQGYTVLDFDYRGSAGYGRDYRTDIAGAMGISDVDGAVAAARWLVAHEGIDPHRIGIYGVSYGGFMTLMSEFRYPGVFAAGIARAAVSDWAHYSDEWTSRILGVPHVDPEAYRISSPIYYAEGLRDHLLITHGLVDDNVHFQDTARLIQRLIELEKDFEVMVYPVERHTIATEASRYDLVRRSAAFFDRWLRGG
jgi:dipeptidyl aminopeptidase/acylaminoacyl peptidase